MTKNTNKMTAKSENTPLLSGAGDVDATALQKGVEELPPPYSEGVDSPSAPPIPPPEMSAPGD